jgi:hypothetical protein
VNKVVAILGIIVLITLGGLFFCAGFFTGTTMSPTNTIGRQEEQSNSEKSVSLRDVEAVIDTKSATISEKIMGILSSAAETAASSISEAVDHRSASAVPAIEEESSKVSIDSLLREIAAGHATNDNCSPTETLRKMHMPTPINPDSLQGKRIVFIGYFKNKIALEVQKLLVGKGYKPHIEVSKTGDNESFVFCGPFKKEANAEKLVRWLRRHDFTEARVVSISNESLEETLYDAMNEDSGPPENVEKDIPEARLPTIPSPHAAPVSPEYMTPVSATQSTSVHETHVYSS